jgi:hypothetical protein
MRAGVLVSFSQRPLSRHAECCEGGGATAPSGRSMATDRREAGRALPGRPGLEVGQPGSRRRFS